MTVGAALVSPDYIQLRTWGHAVVVACQSQAQPALKHCYIVFFFLNGTMNDYIYIMHHDLDPLPFPISTLPPLLWCCRAPQSRVIGVSVRNLSLVKWCDTSRPSYIVGYSVSVSGADRTCAVWCDHFSCVTVRPCTIHLMETGQDDPSQDIHIFMLSITPSDRKQLCFSTWTIALVLYRLTLAALAPTLPVCIGIQRSCNWAWVQHFVLYTNKNLRTLPELNMQNGGLG